VLHFDRIESSPDVLQGEPHIAGTQISVSMVAVMVINGFSAAEIIEDYPELTTEDIEQAIAWDGTTERF
jgi:uncharacterized protein (DUF433 family)